MITLMNAIESLGVIDQVVRIVGNDYDGIEWVNEPSLTKEEVEVEYEKLLEADLIQQVKDNRSNAYKKESDPLFFKAQRGEVTAAEWEAKVEEIRQRFPYTGLI